MSSAQSKVSGRDRERQGLGGEDVGIEGEAVPCLNSARPPLNVGLELHDRIRADEACTPGPRRARRDHTPVWTDGASSEELSQGYAT